MKIYVVYTDIPMFLFLVSDPKVARERAVKENGFDGNPKPVHLLPELNNLTVH